VKNSKSLVSMISRMRSIKMLGKLRSGMPSRKLKKLILPVILLSSGCASTSILDKNLFEKNQRYDSLPSKVICQGLEAFDVKLGEKPETSNISIKKGGIEWAGSSTVTQFIPSKPYQGFSKYIFLTTPVSKDVTWVMGIGYFETNEVADRAALNYARWYSDKMSIPLKDSMSGLYILRDGDVELMIMSYKSMVKVGCEHKPTRNKGLREALPHILGNS
jgi:hypothetical protein